MFARSKRTAQVCLYDREVNIHRARLTDRSCGSCVVFRGELLNYCPVLHALNRSERKRERKKRALFSLGLSLGRSHESCARTESPKEVRPKLPQPAVNDCNCDNHVLAAGKRDSKYRSGINRVLISASKVH